MRAYVPNSSHKFGIRVYILAAACLWFEILSMLHVKTFTCETLDSFHVMRALLRNALYREPCSQSLIMEEYMKQVCVVIRV